MVAKDPKAALEDRKIATQLDDLLQDCIDACTTAGKLIRGKTMKLLDQPTRARFNKFQDAVLKTSEATEDERDRCLSGSATDPQAVAGMSNAPIGLS
ncbi:MAG: hypothetical protein AAF393_17845 [Pseudomonadota bacterium]